MKARRVIPFVTNCRRCRLISTAPTATSQHLDAVPKTITHRLNVGSVARLTAVMPMPTQRIITARNQRTTGR
nr:hypothetical protein GCM10020092_017170 [Actinoplanes digitatis]